jgi:hypothetical protein
MPDNMGFGSPVARSPSVLERIQNGLLGPSQSYGGLLSPEDQQAARRQAMMATATQLLSAGGYSQTPTTLGQAIGPALMAGQQTQQQAGQDMLQAMLIKTKLAKSGQTKSGIKDIDPAKFTADSVAKYAQSGNYGDLVANPNAGGGSDSPLIQAYNIAKSQGYKDDILKFQKDLATSQANYPYTVATINGVPTLVDRTTGAPVYSPNQAPAASPAGPQYTPPQAAPRQVPLSTLGTEANAKSELANAGATGGETGKGNAERNQTFVNEGLSAADSLPVLNRAISLLDAVPTGGFDAAALQAKNFLGVTGADEAELSANMGKAVLSQLRATFGAAFTEREGSRLQEIEAGFGKSTEGNKRLLSQTKQIVERAARRGIEAAKKAGDDFSAAEIQRSMNMDLTPNAAKKNSGWTIEEVK